jgi:predicted nuclease of predicted toxin-antitoxin system
MVLAPCTSRVASASDSEIMGYAFQHRFVVFTHDLDFGILLAQSKARGPSVIQVRTNDVSPGHLGEGVVTTLKNYRNAIDAGALVTVDQVKSRIRILPI